MRCEGNYHIAMKLHNMTNSLYTRRGDYITFMTNKIDYPKRGELTFPPDPPVTLPALSDCERRSVVE